MNIPRITVLLPVFNGAAFLRPAIDSILGQTYRDFELLIIDDGSTDASREIAASYADPRIHRLENGRNLGLIATLNRGLDQARGEFIARMDADDLSFPDRFARQVGFLDRHPEVGVCGTWYERAAPEGTTLMRPPGEDSLIRLLLTFDTVFAHNTIMLRRDFLERHGLRYDPACPYAEDYDFWVRCARHTRLANIPEVLLHYRYHPDNTSNRYRTEQIGTADRVRAAYLADLGLAPTTEELALHLELIQFRLVGNLQRLRAAGDWLLKLAAALQYRLDLPPAVIHAELGRYWYGACGQRAQFGLAAWRLFRAYPMGHAAGWPWLIKLLGRSLLRLAIPAPEPAS